MNNEAIEKSKREFEALPGIKEDRLLKLGSCAVCGKKMLEAPEPTFYRVHLERAIWDQGAIRRRVGLQMALGDSGALAAVMGPNDDLAKVYEGPHEVVVHETCAHRLNSLLELFPKPKEESDGPTS